EDAALLARVADLSRALGIATPRVRRIDSFGLEAQAYAAGLVAPQLLVADGILLRLSEAERDAILGHVATRSLEALALVTPVAVLLATASSTVATAGSAGALIAAFVVLLRRVV